MKDEPQITLPDFDEWAKLNFPRSSFLDQQRIGSYLKQAFNQGESYGVFKGYNAGYNRGHNEGFIKGQDSAQILRNITDIVEGK